MAFTSKTIEQIKFNQGRKGYLCEEVDGFLETAAKEFQALEARCEKAEKKEKEYDDAKASLSDALISAQNIAKNIVEKAKADAEKLLADANANAERIRLQAEAIRSDAKAQAEKEKQSHQDEIAALHDFAKNYKAQIAVELEYCVKTFRDQFESDRMFQESKLVPSEKETTGMKENTQTAASFALEEKEETRKEECKEEKKEENATLFTDDAAKEEDMKKAVQFDLDSILKDLPESDAELKRMIDDLL